MILISHRGNLNGPNPEMENKPTYIQEALDKGYHVEIDVWYVDGNFYLGHDKPETIINVNMLSNPKLWCHAKNIEALEKMICHLDIHCFWHETDTYTLTTDGYIWTFPNKPLCSNSIACNPSMTNFSGVKKAMGVCSDFIANYKIRDIYNKIADDSKT